MFLANIHPELQAAVLDQVEKPELVVLDTMNLWIEGSREALVDTLRRVDVVLLNDEEVRMLTGEPHLVRAARKTMEMGPPMVIIKKGEHGSLVLTREFTFSAPAYPIEFIHDPTGAGDTFAGGFLGYLASCPDPRRGSRRPPRRHLRHRARLVHGGGLQPRASGVRHPRGDRGPVSGRAPDGDFLTRCPL